MQIVVSFRNCLGGVAVGGKFGTKKRPSSRTVRDDWYAWIPNEMDELFSATRSELESSNVILSISIDEALSYCEQGEYERAGHGVEVSTDLFNRLCGSLTGVLRTIREHASSFGTLPNVSPLSASNFRGPSAQRIALMSSMLSRVVFNGRTRFFHKLDSLGDILSDLQKEAHKAVNQARRQEVDGSDTTWKELEILSYDLASCMAEATVVLKSFFCALPIEELEPFRSKLVNQLPALLANAPGLPGLRKKAGA
jgi:hypothetical protein